MTKQEYLKECARQSKEKQLFEDIRPMVLSAINESISENKKKSNGNSKISIDKLVKKLMKNEKFKKKAIQYLTDDDAYDGWTNALDGKTYDVFDNLSDGSKRKTVTQRLKDKKIDCAPLAYELWPNMSQDAARSWFYKKVDGKNESFTDEEISTLYGLLNNNLK